MLFLTAFSYSQAITVNTTTYTVPQLVNDVLINSPCSEVSNISWSTGSNFGSTNGIGYFSNTNPNFPIQSGIILSTGSAVNAPGPNTSVLSDGSASWPGDTDLENILLQAGIQVNSVNATILEFDFTPLSPNFSFDFLFTSEEYGNFQCDFSDAFAFLLTNLNTGVTTNLAVVPNTNTPISVTTIRDFLYNSSCPSVNSEYFGSFNGNTTTPISATNFNGQTKVLRAESVLTPNVPYHIKLVIADRSDFNYDSAIFISSNSFKIGQNVLGADLTIQNNIALCPGSSFVLSTGLDPANYSFEWTLNNNVIANETGPDLEILGSGTYGVTFTNILFPCEVPETDFITVEYYPTFTTPDPINIYKCNTGQTTYDFDLSYNNTIVVAGLNPGTSVSYHNSLEDAEANINPLPSIFTGTGNETIYVRIQNTTGCAVVKSFELLLIPPPIANQPQNLTACAVAFNSANGSFNFIVQNPFVLNGQQASIFAVSYHSTLAQAQNGTDPLPTSNYVTTGNQTIYVRLENKTDPNCFALTSFQLFVNNLPPVDSLTNLLVCEEYVLPPLTNGNYFTGPNGTGTPLFAGDIIDTTQIIYIFNTSGGIPNCRNQSSFTVTIIDPESITPNGGTYCTSYTLPGLLYGNYYTQPGGNGTIIPVGTVLTQSQTVYLFYQFPETPFCVVNTNFNVTIIPFQNLPAFSSVFDCNSYVLPNLSSGNYYSLPGGNGSIIPAGTVISATQTIYVYVENGICNDQKSFTVYINLVAPPNAENCSNYVLPVLPIGNYYTGPAGSGTLIPAGTVITSSQTIYIYIPTNGTPNCTDNVSFDVIISEPFTTIPSDTEVCGSYTLPPITVGNYFTGTGGTGTMLASGDIITTTQVIYIYKQVQPGQNCTNEISYLVTVTPYPVVDLRPDIAICHSYTLTPLVSGDYYTQSGGNGTLLPAGTVITESQTIYIYKATATSPPCSAENIFTLTIYTIEADNPAPVTTCDSYILPGLNVGNYFTQSGGLGTMLLEGDVITESQILYIYAETDNRGQKCTDENLFPIVIGTTPIVNPIPSAMTLLCDNDALNDGITAFDLTTLNATALGSQSASEFDVKYYETLANANTQNNPVTTSTAQTIYIRVSSIIAPVCYAVLPISITVRRVPAPNPIGGTVCIDSETLEILQSHTLFTGLNAATHTFQWFKDGILLNDVTQNSYTVTTPGSYTVIATNNATGCSSNPVTVAVIQSEPANVIATVNSSFASNQTITVTATGVGGNYEYQLDSGYFQSSPVFQNVASGTHLITVRDINGCDSVTISIIVLNYPHYFTPNGDGIHDTWNITDLKSQIEAYINIFDRYGKLITQIKPSGRGWDGTYNGHPLPSTDYWFVVYFTEEGVKTEFRAHFAMKR